MLKHSTIILRGDAEMIEKPKIIAVIAVLIIAIAGIGVAWVVLDNNAQNKTTINAQLGVYGNANGDATIDQSDLGIIRDIINGTKSFDDYPLADANRDGVVDEKDYQMTEQIINADSAHRVRVNIIDRLDGGTYVDSVMYPITSAVSTGAANTILLFKYLGIVNEIKGFSWYEAPDRYLFPEYQPLITSDQRLGSSSTIMDLEKVSELVDKDGVSAIITADNRTYVTNASQFEAMGVDVVRVAPAAVDSTDYMSTVLMIAFLFDTDGKGYMEKCSELISWYEDFFTDLNSKLQNVSTKVSAVTSSSNNAISSNTSDYTNVLLAAGAVFPLTGVDWSGSASKTYDYTQGDSWLNAYNVDYVIPIRTSVVSSSASAPAAFSWYGGIAITAGSPTLKLYMSYFQTLECYQKGNVYVVCGDMPVVLRIAYVAQILYPGAVGENFAYNYNVDFVEKFFGWSESDIAGKPFCVSMSDVGLTP